MRDFLKGLRYCESVYDHVHAAVFNMENQQGPAGQHTGKSAQCHVAAWMGGEFGGEGIRAYVWLNPSFVYHNTT